MSKPPEMPKFKALKHMAPDDPFYRRGYVVGARVLGRSPGSPGQNQSAMEMRIKHRPPGRVEAGSTGKAGARWRTG